MTLSSEADQKPSVSNASEARNARRRRRSEIQRMKVAAAIGFEACDYPPYIPKRRKSCFRELPASERCNDPGTDSKFGAVAPDRGFDLHFSSPSSSEAMDAPPEASVKNEGALTSEDKKCESLSGLEYGSISVMGRRRGMEDAVAVAPVMVAGEFTFFAAYDGHGGSTVADACRDRLHNLLENEINGNRLVKENHDDDGDDKQIPGEMSIEWEKVLKECFSKMDEEVQSREGGEVEEEGVVVEDRAVGSTAVVVLVGKEAVIVANCGDSRVVLYRGGVATPLSEDHKPERPDEKERVEAAGGRILNWNGSRIQGVLATSRSIGDHYLRPYVISEPEITVNERTESDEFLVIATDGLWDVISNEVACEVVANCWEGKTRRRHGDGDRAGEAAAMLAELAMAKGSRDNISVIVVRLNK